MLFKSVYIPETDSHLKQKCVCSVCFSSFTCYDSKGKLTGSSTLKRHLSTCKKISNVSIESFGTLAKKKKVLSQFDLDKLKDHETEFVVKNFHPLPLLMNRV